MKECTHLIKVNDFNESLVLELFPWLNPCVGNFYETIFNAGKFESKSRRNNFCREHRETNNCKSENFLNISKLKKKIF